MAMDETATQIRAGDLQGARASAVEAVKRRPADPKARLALAEVLVLLGEWEKVDTHLDLASTQDPAWTQISALGRQLVRAAAHREDTWAHGRPPDLVADPDARIETALRILAESRAGGDVATLRAEADAALPPVQLRMNDAALEGWRDADDRCADVLEVLTSTGKYVWVSLAQVSALALRPVERERDRVWRPAELDVVGGPSGVVYLPMIYPAPPGATLTDAQRLGRETDWTEAGGLACGAGQRCWLLGDDLVAAAEAGEIEGADGAPEDPADGTVPG